MNYLALKDEVSVDKQKYQKDVQSKTRKIQKL